MSKEKTTRELKVAMCKAGRTAMEELITVARMSIFASKTDEGAVNDDLGAEKMKIAAQAKKVAVMDFFEIATKIDNEEAKMEEEDKKAGEALNSIETPVTTEKKKTDFKSVESRT